MWKGKTLTCVTTGLLFAVAAAGCAGDDTPEPVVDEQVTPATTPPTTTPPTTAAPAGDPTMAPAADAPATAAPAGGGNAELVARGQQAYATSVCVSCHGANATGTPLAPALNDGEWLWVEPGQDVQTQVATIIKTGVSQPKDPAHVAPMLPYGGVPMDDAQVDAIAAYIVSLNQ